MCIYIGTNIVTLPTNTSLFSIYTFLIFTASIYIMYKKILFSLSILLAIATLTSCAAKKDCNGKKMYYNKSGGFWM